MANKKRGEVEIKGEGDDERWILRFGCNEMAILEDEFKIAAIAELAERLEERTSIRELRTIVRIGLDRNHQGMTDEKAGDVIDICGGLEAMMGKIQESLAQSFPTAAAVAAAGVDPKGTAVPDGTGSGSEATP